MRQQRSRFWWEQWCSQPCKEQVIRDITLHQETGGLLWHLPKYLLMPFLICTKNPQVHLIISPLTPAPQPRSSETQTNHFITRPNTLLISQDSDSQWCAVIYPLWLPLSQTPGTWRLHGTWGRWFIKQQGVTYSQECVPPGSKIDYRLCGVYLYENSIVFLLVLRSLNSER